MTYPPYSERFMMENPGRGTLDDRTCYSKFICYESFKEANVSLNKKSG